MYFKAFLLFLFVFKGSTQISNFNHVIWNDSCDWPRGVALYVIYNKGIYWCVCYRRVYFCLFIKVQPK